MVDALLLARLQFAANITFHILFPTITIALAWILLLAKIFYNKTKQEKWMEFYRFWVKVFALCFALGVVSGITMSFQFGTNWPGFMEKVGNIAGPLLGYEVLTAFFLEASFLGIMLFGYRKVSNVVHTISTFLVAIGTTTSAFWIIALNAWMQTPAGFEMIDGVAHVTSWIEVIFNPSMVLRMVHMLLASGLTASFLIAGISSYRYLKGDKSDTVLASIKLGIYIAAILIPVQIVGGDSLGLNSFKYQPAKVAAIEAKWKTERGASFNLFAVPNEKEKKNHFEISIPKAGSLILTHELNGEVKGLEEYEGKYPPVAPVFYSFRIMLGIAVLMWFFSWAAFWQIRKRGKISNLMARVLYLMTFSGWVATVAGWYVAEIGRQPFLVYNVLTTAEASNYLPGTMVGSTLAMYLVTYFLLMLAFIFTLFYMARHATTETLLEEAYGKLDK